MKIAIAGKQRSGKDTVASMISLLSEGSLTKLPLSYMVYEIANQLFNQKTKNRKLLVDIGDAMRSINENVFVDFTIDQFKKLSIGTGYTEGFIVPDVRFINEAERLQEAGFTLIKVEAPEYMRIERGADSEYLDDPSESEVDDIVATYTIQNDGTKGELFDKVEAIFNELSQGDDNVE